ncbi:MAG: SRPBCC family protein [Actinomycetota bacterium]
MPTEIHEETMAAPAEDVWGFMVDPAALSAWFGADAWLEPRVGAPVVFRFGDGSTRRGVVEDVERFRRLTWRWREHRGAGFSLELGEASTVEIELERLPEGTRVRIRETGPAAAVGGKVA